MLHVIWDHWRSWRRRLIEQNHCEVAVSQDIRTSLQEADIVITVTSALDFLIEPGDLKPGAVVCDVARPRNVSRDVSLKRNDVLVIEGGVINVPGDVDFILTSASRRTRPMRVWQKP